MDTTVWVQRSSKEVHHDLCKLQIKTFTPFLTEVVLLQSYGIRLWGWGMGGGEKRQ